MNKKLLVFGILGVFALALVTAAVVTYYSQKKIDMEIESPVILEGDLIESVSIVAGDGYRIYLVEGENKLNKTIDVEFQLSLVDDLGVLVADTTGFYVAYSDDIQYAYNPIYGNVADWDGAKTWMYANLDWFDWYLTDVLANYDASIITNHEGNSAHDNAIALNTPIPQDLETGKFYAVIYVDVNGGVVPGNYTLSVDVMPI